MSTFISILLPRTRYR